MRSLSVALLLFGACAAGQAQNRAPHPPSYDIALPAHPFGIVTSTDGNWVFVALTNDAGDGGIAVVQRSAAGYAMARVVPLPLAATGLALTHDGNLLIAAAGAEVYFLDVSGVSTGGAGAVTIAGFLSDGASAGSIWASVTADDGWLFVCDETAGQLTVIDVNRALSSGFSQSSIMGTILVGAAPTATVFSHDGVWAYTTVQTVSSYLGWPIACTEEGTTDPTLVNPQGAVVVFNVAVAASNPSLAVTSTSQFVPAGCSPVRLALSPDALTLYVTARNSNEVLALDPSKFATDPMNAVTGAAPVGIAPVPVAWIDSGALVVVGNSNRFQQPGIPQSLDVLDAAKLRAGAGAAALIRTIPAGSFPRCLTLSPDGETLFLSNYDSDSLQVMEAARLAVAEPGRAATGQ
jgi:DNA-binding beta-propeller fold protein YncE